MNSIHWLVLSTNRCQHASTDIISQYLECIAVCILIGIGSSFQSISGYYHHVSIYLLCINILGMQHICIECIFDMFQCTCRPKHRPQYMPVVEIHHQIEFSGFYKLNAYPIQSKTGKYLISSLHASTGLCPCCNLINTFSVHTFSRTLA